MVILFGKKEKLAPSRLFSAFRDTENAYRIGISTPKQTSIKNRLTIIRRIRCLFFLLTYTSSLLFALVSMENTSSIPKIRMEIAEL